MAIQEEESPPSDGENPYGGRRPSTEISYTYSFNEDNTVLYLDGNQFYKVNS